MSLKAAASWSSSRLTPSTGSRWCSCSAVMCCERIASRESGASERWAIQKPPKGPEREHSLGQQEDPQPHAAHQRPRRRFGNCDAQEEALSVECDALHQHANRTARRGVGVGSAQQVLRIRPRSQANSCERAVGKQAPPVEAPDLDPVAAALFFMHSGPRRRAAAPGRDARLGDGHRPLGQLDVLVHAPVELGRLLLLARRRGCRPGFRRCRHHGRCGVRLGWLSAGQAGWSAISRPSSSTGTRTTSGWREGASRAG